MSSPTLILLAGGAGVRVRHLYPGLPKPMIPVAGQPFIEWVIRYWRAQGVSRVIVSLGHLAEVAEDYFKHRPSVGMQIETVREPAPMGTGGAVRYALSAALSEDPDRPGDPVIVANADSLFLAEIGPARKSLQDPTVDAVVLGTSVADAQRYGSLDVGQDRRLRGFREKGAGTGLINAGVYLFRRRVIELFPDRTPLSMETEVFPELLASGLNILVDSQAAPFLDMGTPEALQEVEGFIAAHANSFS